MSIEAKLKEMQEKEEQNEGFWSKLSPKEFLEQMFLCTDPDGIVYVPAFYATVSPYQEDFSFRCKMKWNYADCERVLREFYGLMALIRSVAAKGVRLGDPLEEKRALLTDAELQFWNTYLRPFSTESEWAEKSRDIYDRLETVEDVRALSKKLSDGELLTESEREFLRENMDVTVSPEEKKALRRHTEANLREAAERLPSGLGDSFCAYHLIIRVRRVGAFLLLNMPQSLCEREINALIEVLALQRYAVRVEDISNTVRLRTELEDVLPEDVLDSYSNPVSVNTRKSMASLFVYLILKEHSSNDHPMKQQDILDALADRPYEIVLERKALGRTLHNLADSNLGIYTDRRRGAWYMGGKH